MYLSTSNIYLKRAAKLPGNLFSQLFDLFPLPNLASLLNLAGCFQDLQHGLNIISIIWREIDLQSKGRKKTMSCSNTLVRITHRN